MDNFWKLYQSNPEAAGGLVILIFLLLIGLIYDLPEFVKSIRGSSYTDEEFRDLKRRVKALEED